MIGPLRVRSDATRFETMLTRNVVLPFVSTRARCPPAENTNG